MVRTLPGGEKAVQEDESGVRLFIRDFLLSDASDISNLPTSAATGLTAAGGKVISKCACGSTAHYTDNSGALHFYELQNDNAWRKLV
jgi:hypothetical protein